MLMKKKKYIYIQKNVFKKQNQNLQNLHWIYMKTFNPYALFTQYLLL